MTEPGDGTDPPVRVPGRVLRLAGLSLLGVLVLGGLWVVVTGLVARSELDQARGELRELRSAIRSGDDERALGLVHEIADHAGTAHGATTGPAWWVSANLPGLGAPLRTARVMTAQADRLGTVLPGVVQLRRTVSAISQGAATRVDLTGVERALPELHRAASAAHEAKRAVAATGGSWLPFVASARTAFAASLTKLDGELRGADRAASIAVPMLGARRPQRYFVGFLNEAEARGVGGIPGGFAIATADRGRIAFEHFGSDTELFDLRAEVELGADFDARYAGNDPLGTIQNSTLSPDFSYAARIWAGMWSAKTGERIDGAIAVDPTALQYLLRAAHGGARLPGGGAVSAGNVVALAQQTQYARFPGLSRAVSDARKRFLTTLARSVSTRLSDIDDPAALIRAVSRAAGERRFVLWSRDRHLERQLRTARWAGTLGSGDGAPYAGFVVNNSTGSKLDYYLQRRMTYRRDDCAAGGRATATLALTNAAPRSGLPVYVTYRADTPPPGARPGDNRVLLSYYADRGARIRRLTVAGRSVPFVAQPEGDTVAVTTTVELPAGRTVTASVQVAEPRATGPVAVLRQPLVRPIEVGLSADRCQ